MRSETKRMAAVTSVAVAVVMVAGASTGVALSRSKTTPAEAPSAFSRGSGRTVAAWNQELLAILKTPGAQPATVHPTRSYALLHAAVYDAVVSITRADQPYLFELAAPRSARADVAADEAAHDVLVALYPSFQAALDNHLADDLGAIPSGKPMQDGIRVGHLAATLMLAARADDGSATAPPPFVAPPADPGAYQLTPPNHPAPAFTNWGSVTPFVLASGDAFRPPPPPDLTSSAWADAIDEVESLGRDTTTARTDDQTTEAAFWAPPIWNTWNEIADGQVAARGTTLEDAAKLFAQLNLTLADTAIAVYDAKYHYLFWRPVTAIRAGTPGNPAVVADPTWTPLATTAADPSYPGAHSSFSEAAATVLGAFFGPDVDLSVTSDGLAGVSRHFVSFQAAATEAGLSRIFAGQHTRLDHDAGVALGLQVARAVLAATGGGT